jgi:imidazolonepropionase-like amidohydrolase
MKKKCVILAGWMAFLALALPSPSRAAPIQDEGGSEEAEEGEEDEEEEGDEWFACVGGDVYTGTGAVLRGATVLAKNGRIRELGHEIHVPESATVLDVTGLRVYPGLVAHSSSGLVGGSGDFADTVDPFSSRMVLALASGITTAGQSETALKLKRGEIEGVVMRENYLAPQSFGNAAARRSLREKLEAASKYLRKYAKWEEDVKQDKELREPSKKGVDSTIVDILHGKVLARFNAEDRAELLEIARLAQRYGFRPVIDGCREGWTVADELGRAGAYAIVTPRSRRDKTENLVRPGGSSIENAAILHRHGVQVAVVPGQKGIDLGGIVGRDILHLPIEAGFAIRGGLPEDAAFDAITKIPARLLGVEHRVGTLEVGKDCDLIVTDGDVLHYETFVQFAVVEGVQVYDKQQELYFAHIRPRPVAEVAPEEKTDPGEEPPEEDEDASASEDEEED